MHTYYVIYVYGINYSQAHAPFVELEKMKDMYQESHKVIQRSAPRVVGENVEISVYLLEDFLKIPEYNMTDVHPDAHFTWYELFLIFE